MTNQTKTTNSDTTVAKEKDINITEIVNRYFENNTNMSTLKKAVDKDKESIKTFILNDNNGNKVETDIAVATVSTKNKQSYKEEELINYLKTLEIPGLIETKEVVNMKALEDAIYHSQIAPEEIAPFIVNSISYALLVKKVK